MSEDSNKRYPDYLRPGGSSVPLKEITPYPEWYIIYDREGAIHHVPQWRYIEKLQKENERLKEALEECLSNLESDTQEWRRRIEGAYDDGLECPYYERRYGSNASAIMKAKQALEGNRDG